MKTHLSLLVFVLAGWPINAGEVDKPQLRKLARLPEFSIGGGVGFSTTFGFYLNGEKPDPAREIARLRQELKGDASDAARYQRLGLLLYKLDQKKESDDAFARAVAICRKQVEEHPDDSTWRAKLGDALILNDQEAEGEKLLRRVVKESPSEWRAWLALAQYADSQALQALRKGDKPFRIHGSTVDEMIAGFREFKPSKEQVAQMRKLLQEAGRCYDRAVQLAPREKDVYFQRGLWRVAHRVLEACVRQNQGEKVNLKAELMAPETAADLCQVARLQPDDPRAIATAMFVKMAACAAHYKAIPEGEKRAAFLRECEQFHDWAVDRLEQLSKKVGKNSAVAAELLATWLIVLNMPSEPEEARRAAWSKQSDGKPLNRALDLLFLAVKVDPSRDQAWDLLTASLVEKGDGLLGVVFGKSRLKHKDNAHNRFFLAKCYESLEQFDDAREQLRAGLKSNPKSTFCQMGLVALLLQRADNDSVAEAGKQLDAFGKALQEEKDLEGWKTDFLYLRALHAGLSDQPARARELLKEVLERKKNHKSAPKALAALGD